MNLKQWQRSKKMKAEAEAAAKRTVERVLNAVKEPAMSEFKVGDKVVYRNQCSMIWRGVYTVGAVRSNGDVIERDCIATPKEWLSKATPEEIAAGHRIDNDLGDDFPIENHISPHCQSRDV
ncbi:hypothetical protein NQ910_06295 [Acinetobacter baumannii]|nr:hypothetical protein [Acinetobacter baumannii]MDC4859586.1 hypothetical protein [Acinetobacter baumannii]